MDPKLHLKDPQVLCTLVEFHSVDLDCEPGHLDNVLVHDLDILLVDALQPVEHQVGDEHAYNVYYGDPKGSCVFMHSFVAVEWVLDVIFAAPENS